MKGKKLDHGQSACAIARALQIVGDRWTLLIIREVFYGRQRFGEFQKSLGLAKNILSDRLKKLVDAEILTIEPDAGSSLSHLYVLTPSGEELRVILIALWQWGEQYCFLPGELTATMVDAMNIAPLARLQVTSRDGRILGPRDFRAAPID